MADDVTPHGQNSQESESGPGPGESPVSVLGIGLLTAYLLVLSSLLFWGLYSKWPSCVTCDDQAEKGKANSNANSNANQNANPAINRNGNNNTTGNISQSPNNSSATSSQAGTTNTGTTNIGTQSPGNSNPTTKLAIDSISPNFGFVNSNIQVTIKGKGFNKEANVIFGGILAIPDSVDPGGEAISVRLPHHPEGVVDVVVRNKDGDSVVSKSAFTYNCPPAPDATLFWAVVFAGALGGTLHGLRSLYWYVGNRGLVKSWTLMYILLPFTGALIAVIFYAVIRAGFLPTQSTKDSSLIVIAIAALVGLFSQQAALKLSDIANAILTKPGPGADPKPQASLPPGGTTVVKPASGAPTIKIDQPSGPAAGGQSVKITGTGFKSVKSVTFGGTLSTGIPTITEGTITATTPKHEPGPVDVIVTDNEGNTAKLSYTYTD